MPNRVLQFDLNPRTQALMQGLTHGRAASRWPGMMVRRMLAGSAPAPAEGRKAQRSSA